VTLWINVSPVVSLTHSDYCMSVSLRHCEYSMSVMNNSMFKTVLRCYSGDTSSST